jgi:hypothetical protein
MPRIPIVPVAIFRAFLDSVKTNEKKRKAKILVRVGCQDAKIAV